MKKILFREYFDENELHDFHEMINKEIENNHAYLQTVIERSYARCKEYEACGIKLRGHDWTKKRNDEILRYLDGFYRKSLLMIPIVFFEPDFADVIRNYLREKLQEIGKAHELDEYFLALTSSTEELTVINEQRDLLRIGIQIQENAKDFAYFRESSTEDVFIYLPHRIKEALDKHIDNYAWISTDDLFGKPWDHVDLIKRLKHLLQEDCRDKLTYALDAQSKREALRAAAMKELDIRGKLHDLVEVSRVYSHLRTYRTETYVKTMHNAAGILSELAARIGVSYQDSKFFSYDEIKQFIVSQSTVSQHLIDDRKRGMAYVMIDRDLDLFYGAAAEALAEDSYMPAQTVKQHDCVKGVIANLGRVRGSVRVVQDISELDTVHAGDILVASMTIPEFVPAMEKAAALVTDEGSITCHAAIFGDLYT